jgi:methionyl aminopeptidase
MRTAGSIAADALREIEKNLRPGVSTLELSELAEKLIISRGGKAACKNYKGFPAAVCISIDDEVVHGIPSAGRRLYEGEIVSVDIVVGVEGFKADMARTYPVGVISDKKRKLLATAEESFFEAMKYVRAGGRLRDISRAIQDYNESRGYSLVRALTGHGIGRKMHEDPSIPNVVTNCPDVILERGMTLAVEPMVVTGNYDVEFSSDGWTVKTKDKGFSAHYENTIVVTENGYEILTR